MREIVEWSAGASGHASPRNSRSANESAARHANRALRVQTFEIPDQQQPEVAPRQQPRPAVVRVKRVAHSLDVSVEVVPVEDLI